MKNPWLGIPLADYESHMALPHVAQAQLLSDVFAAALRDFSPQSVAVIGCAGGNGFDRISPQITKRVFGMDINPDYIREAHRRYSNRIPTLELFVGDIQTDKFKFSPVDLVFAALLFEYVDIGIALASIRSVLAQSGRLVSVVQLPNTEIPDITPSPFTSLNALSPLMHLVPPALLARLAAENGYKETDSCIVETLAGKKFQIQTFV